MEKKNYIILFQSINLCFTVLFNIEEIIQQNNTNYFLIYTGPYVSIYTRQYVSIYTGPYFTWTIHTICYLNHLSSGPYLTAPSVAATYVSGPNVVVSLDI